MDGPLYMPIRSNLCKENKISGSGFCFCVMIFLWILRRFDALYITIISNLVVDAKQKQAKKLFVHFPKVIWLWMWKGVILAGNAGKKTAKWGGGAQEDEI